MSLVYQGGRVNVESSYYNVVGPGSPAPSYKSDMVPPGSPAPSYKSVDAPAKTEGELRIQTILFWIQILLKKA